MTAAADQFVLAVGPWTDSAPSQEVRRFGTVSYRSYLDGGVDISFDVPGNSPSAAELSELYTDVWLYRNEVPYARCRVVSLVQTWGADGEDVVQVQAVDYKRLLNARHVQSTLNYATTAEASIIWGVIQHTQALDGGDLGITAGTLTSGTNRDRTYYAGDNIGKILGDLSGVIDGPWWEIDPTLALNVHPYDDFPVQGTPLMLGATARMMARKSGAGLFANSVFVSGDNNQTTPVSLDSTDVSTDPRGRWERSAGFPTTTLQDSVQEKAEGFLAETERPPVQWSVELEPERWLTDADFIRGDEVTLLVPENSVAAQVPGAGVQTRVTTLSFSLTADGQLNVTAELLELT